jgi:NADPH:quinone reductase-like Zn-dependent oxidoreductase
LKVAYNITSKQTTIIFTFKNTAKPNSYFFFNPIVIFHRPEDYPGRELCTVYYAPLNHMDVLFAERSWLPFFNTDTADQGAFLGREFAGRNAKGQRVFGLVSGSALATHVLADSSTLWEVPDKWTLEQASTVSVAYVLVSLQNI